MTIGNRTVILLPSVWLLVGAANGSNGCPRPAPGSVIQSPAEVRSVGGTLEAELTFRSEDLERYCYVTGGGFSPTLRVRPGDKVVLRVKNELASDGPTDAHAAHGQPGFCSAGPMSLLSTNLHFHGLEIPPKCHQDDVLQTLIAPSAPAFEYRFTIPRSQPPGLYWYHPHPHGFSEVQVSGGASGALVVDGIEQLQPAVAGLPERLLILRDQFVPRQHTRSGDGEDAIGKDLSINYVPVRFPLYLPAVMRVRPEQKEFWRILNASADTYYDLQLIYTRDSKRAAQDLQLIALDASAFPRESMERRTENILIPPGGRAEFIATTPAAGAFAQLVSRDYDTGRDGAKNPGRVLANIVSSPGAPPMPVLPAGGAAEPMRPLPASSGRRKLYFSEDRQDLKDPSKPPLYFITVDGAKPHIFDMHAAKPDITVAQGAVEDWTIENRAAEVHVFHIHQLHFQVVQRDGKKLINPEWRDTIDLPAWDGQSAPYPSVTLRMDFRDPAIEGTFVYHCHILEHEDAGMMGSIRVVARRK